MSINLLYTFCFQFRSLLSGSFFRSHSVSKIAPAHISVMIHLNTSPKRVTTVLCNMDTGVQGQY